MKVKHYGATYTYCRLARGGVGFTDADGKPVRGELNEQLLAELLDKTLTAMTNKTPPPWPRRRQPARWFSFSRQQCRLCGVIKPIINITICGVTPEEARYWLQHRCQYCKGLIWFGSSTIHEACAMPLARKLLHVIDLNGTPTVEPEGRNSNERGLR